VFLISFDIDGTLEVGDPPGPVEVALVRRLQALGHVVGSCSDRPVSHQERLWARLGIAPGFTVLKHRLADVRPRFAAAGYYHVGDTDLDDHVARAAGFHFFRAEAGTHRRWAPLLLDPGAR
jgi:phosphoglycolate phosphatase-like HAD superfamily hydrolase